MEYMFSSCKFSPCCSDVSHLYVMNSVHPVHCHFFLSAFKNVTIFFSKRENNLLIALSHGYGILMQAQKSSPEISCCELRLSKWKGSFSHHLTHQHLSLFKKHKKAAKYKAHCYSFSRINNQQYKEKNEKLKSVRKSYMHNLLSTENCNSPVTGKKKKYFSCFTV